jgi:hypothetical protein
MPDRFPVASDTVSQDTGLDSISMDGIKLAPCRVYISLQTVLVSSSEDSGGVVRLHQR